MFQSLLQLLYPTHCRSCGKIIDSELIFCCACHSKIKLVVPLFLPTSERRTINVYAACAYQDPVKNLVYKKFSYDTLACKQMADMMIELVSFDVIKPDFFVPIPLHWTRFAWRGYNQTELIAKRLGKRLKVPVANILKRNRRTIFQSKLSAQDRLKNVDQAFSLNIYDSEKFKDKNIVIVDDLFTSGATIKSAAKILWALKPSEITASVFCRAI